MIKTTNDTESTWPLDQDAVETLHENEYLEKVAHYVLPGVDEFCVRAVLRPGPKLLDVVLPRISLGSRPTIPARIVLTVVARLVCLCLLGGFGICRSSAAPAAFSIPGAVTVSIQSAEALADGAQWSVDGGVPRASGQSVTNLAAGSHAVQFRRPFDTGPTTFFRVRQEP